jgi:23S rRNA pseudouridine2605 synthase
MVFKRSGNSRDGKPGQSSGRRSGGTDGEKRTSSSSRGKSLAAGADRSAKRPAKSYGDTGESRERPEKKSYSSQKESKPYTGKSDDGYKSSFNGGSSSGEKKKFVPRNKPYTGRPSDNDDRPKRSFGSDAGEKKPYASRSKPYSGRLSADDDKPKRSFKAEQGDREESGKRPSTAGPSRPKSAPRERSGERKFTGKPDGDSSYKKRSGTSEPFRKSAKSSYNKITPDRDAPVKTLRSRKEKDTKDTGLIRLNRYIANAGICSRRKADELIEAGVVSVNGVVVDSLGHKVDPLKDEIRYNGELLKREKMVYVLLNKPKDYITTTDDPQERRTVMHLVEKASRERIYPIGRLDRNTTGLLLMTNDGDLADKLSHPRSNIVKLYQVELDKNLTQGDFNKIGFGLELEDGLIKPDTISYVQGGSKKEIGIQIHSGKNRIVRRIFEHLGYEVVKLDRVVYANLTKKDLTRGRWRYLDEKEVIQLKHLI